MPKYTKEEIADAEAILRKYLRPGDTAYCVLRHVSRSGMRREISLFKISGQGADTFPAALSWAAARYLDWSYSPKNNAVKVDGCGMDQGFHLVYSLASKLFRDVPSGKSPGYSLKSEWL